MGRYPATARVVFALRKMLPYIKNTVMTSRFISTTQKDGLVEGVENLIKVLDDAVAREAGITPRTASQQKVFDKIRSRNPMFKNDK